MLLDSSDWTRTGIFNMVQILKFQAAKLDEQTSCRISDIVLICLAYLFLFYTIITQGCPRIESKLALQSELQAENNDVLDDAQRWKDLRINRCTGMDRMYPPFRTHANFLNSRREPSRISQASVMTALLNAHRGLDARAHTLLHSHVPVRTRLLTKNASRNCHNEASV